MPKKVLKPKNRLIVFRICEDEYEALNSACARTEARSLADFARSNLLRSVSMHEGTQELLQRQILNLGHKVSEVESRVQNLLKLLEQYRQ